MKVRHHHPRLRVAVPGLVLTLLLMAGLPVRIPVQATAPVGNRIVSTGHMTQNPSEAESYRKLAAAKRKAAENVPAKRDCYLAWARYYDCLAARSESGDSRDCGAQPADC
jgi:hypothetical protein